MTATRFEIVSGSLDPAAVDRLLPAVRESLAGTGPPIAPLPAGSERNRVLAAVRPDVPVDYEDVAACLPTSGSTGAVKAVLLTADGLRASAAATLDRLGGPGQWLLALPPARVAGLQVLVRSVLAGIDPVVLDGSDGFVPEAFAAAAGGLEPGPRHYTALVPTQLVRLLDAGVDLRGFDRILLGAAATPPRLVEQAAAAGARVTKTYGMTETCGGCVYDGIPLAGVEAEIAAGLVRLRGPVLARGYRLAPEQTATAFAGGWFETSDLGRIGPDGRLTVLGRADDVIVTGGIKVPPVALEHALLAHPDVAGCAIGGVPDAEWGERVVAYVVPTRSARRRGEPGLETLRDRVAAEYPRSWAPRELVVVDALPLLPSGKLDRAALR